MLGDWLGDGRGGGCDALLGNPWPLTEVVGFDMTVCEEVLQLEAESVGLHFIHTTSASFQIIEI